MRTAADLPIVKACPLEGELPGVGASRHCALCDTRVVDLSQLTTDEADALMRSARRPRCVSYLVDQQGAVVHASRPPTPARRRLPLVAGALLLAACNGTVPAEGPGSMGAASAPLEATSAHADPVALRGEIEAPTPPMPAAPADGVGCATDSGAETKSPSPQPTTAPSAQPPKSFMKRGKVMRMDDTR